MPFHRDHLTEFDVFSRYFVEICRFFMIFLNEIYISSRSFDNISGVFEILCQNFRFFLAPPDEISNFPSHYWRNWFFSATTCRNLRHILCPNFRICDRLFFHYRKPLRIFRFFSSIECWISYMFIWNVLQRNSLFCDYVVLLSIFSFGKE